MSGRRLLVAEDVDIAVNEAAPSDDAPGASMSRLDQDSVEWWFEFEMSGHPVRFGFVSSDQILTVNEGNCAHAVSWPEAGVVVLDRDLRGKPSLLAVVLLHELVHVALGAAYGSSELVSAMLGARTEKQADEREESLAVYLSNQLAGPLLASGLLRLPKLSKRRGAT